MITFDKKKLDNGLTVIVHHDNSTPMAAVNLLYRVGSRNESGDHTGFAHLFEHLMFGGSRNVADFDAPLQIAGGENNAFTNNDYTNYYIALPTANIETALWAESDRCGFLTFSEQSLEVQRKVVVEEFNQRYLNQPYGDLWLLLRPLCYKTHPYQWTTIGKTPEHIKNATLNQVRAFHDKYYTPANAILTIGSNLSHDQMFALAEKWFADLPSRPAPADAIPAEPVQTEQRRLVVERDVPVSVIYMAFPMAARNSREYAVCDVISDILSNGTSSRLYQRLVKDNALFSSVNGYVTGDMDAGLFIVTGRLLTGVDINDAENALWNELRNLQKNKVSDYELQKNKNKFEATQLFSEINVLNKAMNLAFFEMVGDASLINTEVQEHNSVTADEILAVSNEMFTPQRSNILHYLKTEKN